MNPDTWQQLMGAIQTEEASLAPYKIFKTGDKFVVKNNANQVKASFKTHTEAVQYLRALYSQVRGAARKAAKTPWTGKEKPD